MKHLHKQILKIANTIRRSYERYGDTDLSCKCAIVSTTVSKALAKASIDHMIAYAEDDGMCHVFIIVDHMLLDLTATQFSTVHDRIVFRKWKGTREYEWYWKPAMTFMTVDELIATQVREDWPREQIHPGHRPQRQRLS